MSAVCRGRVAALSFSVMAAVAACDDATPPEREEEALKLDLELVTDAVTAPVLVTAPDNDARLFVVERVGRVRIVENEALLPTPFLDISDRVQFGPERGLLGMAFDPQYAANGQFYVYYVDRNGDAVLERFSSTPGSDLAGASGGVVITIPHGGPDLFGGTVAFGPDDMLYIAPGDGGCCDDPQNNAQNMGVLLGKMLRLDVSTHPYTVPPSNPFVGQAGVRPEIWASGLRNPWRFAFDPISGQLYVADVGEREREEVSVVSAAAEGLNYGWRLMEGSQCFNPSTGCMTGVSLTLPAHDYPRVLGCAIIGGYVYRGSAMPELVGHYVYGDFCGGWVRSFRWTGTEATDHRHWSTITAPETVSFGRDAAGELYLVTQTAVWKIVRGE